MHIEFDRNAYMAVWKGGTPMGSNQPFSIQAKLIKGCKWAPSSTNMKIA